MARQKKSPPVEEKAPEPEVQDEAHIWFLEGETLTCSRCHVVFGSFASQQPCPGKEWCE